MSSFDSGLRLPDDFGAMEVSLNIFIGPTTGNLEGIVSYHLLIEGYIRDWLEKRSYERVNTDAPPLLPPQTNNIFNLQSKFCSKFFDMKATIWLASTSFLKTRSTVSLILHYPI